MSPFLRRWQLLRCFLTAICPLRGAKDGCIGESIQSGDFGSIGNVVEYPSLNVAHRNAYDGSAVVSPLHQLYYYRMFSE